MRESPHELLNKFFYSGIEWLYNFNILRNIHTIRHYSLDLQCSLFIQAEAELFREDFAGGEQR